MAKDWHFVNQVAILSQVDFPVAIYRDGTRTIRAELERLIDTGDPDGQRLAIQIDGANNVLIDVEPASPEDSCATLDCDGCVDNLCTQRAGLWLCPETDAIASTDLPHAAFLEWFEIRYDKCRARYHSRLLDLDRLGVRFDFGGR